MDIRQVLSDNSIKDMLAEEDGTFITEVNLLLVGADVVVPATGVAQHQTIAGGITRDTINDALKIMPSTPNHLETATMLINNVTAKEFQKWTRDEVGGDAFLCERVDDELSVLIVADRTAECGVEPEPRACNRGVRCITHGRHFFEVDFPTADALSFQNKKFIADLMPKHPIYIPLLPPEAQAVIGNVNDASRTALSILEREGFEFNGMVDIFEAGPVVQAHRDRHAHTADSPHGHSSQRC